MCLQLQLLCPTCTQTWSKQNWRAQNNVCKSAWSTTKPGLSQIATFLIKVVYARCEQGTRLMLYVTGRNLGSTWSNVVGLFCSYKMPDRYVILHSFTKSRHTNADNTCRILCIVFVTQFGISDDVSLIPRACPPFHHRGDQGYYVCRIRYSKLTF